MCPVALQIGVVRAKSLSRLNSREERTKFSLLNVCGLYSEEKGRLARPRILVVCAKVTAELENSAVKVLHADVNCPEIEAFTRWDVVPSVIHKFKKDIRVVSDTILAVSSNLRSRECSGGCS